MKRYLLNTFSFLGIAFLLGNLIALLANFQLAKGSFYKPSFIANYESKELDYLIVGSSRGLTTLDTKKIDSALSIKGINGSMDDTGLPSHFLMIQQFFESGHSAKYCILTLDLGHFEESESGINDNDYRFSPFSDQEFVMDHFRKNEVGLIKPLSLSRFFPVFAYSYYNMELFYPSLISFGRPLYRNRFDEKGDYSYPDNSTHPSQEETWRKETKSISNPLLDEIKSYLKSKNCELIIYIAPYYGVEISVSNPNGFPLIDQSGLFSETNYFYDVDHVNLNGKKEATLEFIKRMDELGIKN